MSDVRVTPVWYMSDAGLCRGSCVTYRRGEQRLSARLPWLVATASEAVQFIEQQVRKTRPHD